MARPRAEIGRLTRIKASHFGVLAVKCLFESAGRSSLSILHIALKPGARAPALYHQKTDEFFFVLRGTVLGQVDGKPCRLTAGGYCHLPPGVVHEFRAGRSGAQTLEVFFPRLDLRKPDIVQAT